MENRISKARSAIDHWTLLETYIQGMIDIDKTRQPPPEIRIAKRERGLRYVKRMKANAIQRLQNLEAEIESDDEA